MTGLAWFLAALVAVVLAGGAGMGLVTWAGVGVAALLLSGWFVVAIVVKRDIDALGGDGVHVGARVIILGWLGLAFWLLMRRDLLDQTVPRRR